MYIENRLRCFRKRQFRIIFFALNFLFYVTEKYFYRWMFTYCERESI